MNSKIRPKSAMVRPNTSFPDSRASKTTVLLHEVESPSKKTRPKTSSKRSSVNNSVNQFGSFSQLTFLPRRPTSSRSSITSSKSCVSQALINQNLSHPTHNKNYSFSNVKVKAIERENMRLYKNLLKINTKSSKSEIKPKNNQNTGFNNKSPVKATHKPKIVRKTTERSDFDTRFDNSLSHVSSNVGGGDDSITKKKKKRISTRPSSAVSNISMKSNTSVRSNASTTTLSKRPVTAAQLNRERDRDRIEKDNLRLYTRLQQVKPTLVTRY